MKRKYTRRTPQAEPFVVYVTFPSSSREYCYLCNIPGIRQGDTVIANGCKVRVQRTASFDPIAVRFVTPLPNAAEASRKERMQEIVSRLRILDKEVADLEMWEKVARKNTEAKRLLTELKKLIGAGQ